MNIEILNLTEPMTAEAAEAARVLLKALPGVQQVSFFDTPASLHVSVDNATPSRAGLVATLEKAGISVIAPRASHASGNCCGGCGS